jgi:hypothetical protein
MYNKNITDILNDILIICGKNNITFTLTKEETKNYIILDIKSMNIDVNIFDYEDVNLENLINEKLKELNKLFN